MLKEEIRPARLVEIERLVELVKECVRAAIRKGDPAFKFADHLSMEPEYQDMLLERLRQPGMGITVTTAAKYINVPLIWIITW